MNSLRVGLFLSLRTIKHASKWTTGLIIFVMVLTFLNLIVVSGVLVGLIYGSELAYKEKYIGNLGISPLDKKTSIENIDEIMSIVKNNTQVRSFSIRYVASGQVEANYQDRSSADTANINRGRVYGINPETEQDTTSLGDSILDGEYLTQEDAGKFVLLGKDIVEKYSIVADADPNILKNTDIGSKVRVTINGATGEYVVKGIIKVKAADLSQSVVMVDSEFRKLAGRNPSDVDMVAIKTVDDPDALTLKNVLINNGFDQYAKIQTFDEGVPAFVKNMKQLFGLLGNLFGAIGIIVSAVVVGIVVFINAINRRKQIGILKGIGITEAAIKWCYVIQSLFYASIGSALGLFMTYVVIKPHFDSNPIDFPFSDGVLVADLDITLYRVLILMVITVVAGYLPARMIVRKNTLNAILGR